MKNLRKIDANESIRICGLGIAVLLGLEMLHLWQDLDKLYGPAAIVDPSLLRAQQLDTGLNIHILANAIPIPIIAGTYLLCCILIVIQRYSWLACLILLILHHSLWINDYNWAYGADYIAYSGMVIYFLFSKSRQGFSLLNPRYGVFLLKAQLTLIYFFGGLSKVSGTDWQTGGAVWKAVQQVHVGSLFQVPLSWATYGILWQIVSWTVILLELGYFMIWYTAPLRKVVLIGIIILHIGIAVTLGLYHFAAVMIWLNICAWYLPYLSTTSKPTYSSLAKQVHTSAGACATTTPVIQGKEVEYP